MTVDFGFRPELSIGSNVFYDANDNGVRDAGEAGIEGVTVDVYDTGADGIPENGDDNLVGSDVTDENGDYFVGELLEGDYYVRIDTPDADFPRSSTNIGSSDDPNNNTDGDDNGLQTGGTGAGVWSNVVTLSINDEPTGEPGSGGDQDAADDNNGNMTVDFGFRPELSIGSNVFVDSNNNGVRDAGEAGIAGITVEVFDTGADGIAENADDNLVGSDVTDANGDYFVGELLEGDYYVKIMNVDPLFPTSSSDIASSANPNNDTDNDDNGLQPDGSGTGVWSNVVTLSINGEPTGEPGSGGTQDNGDDDNGNMTVDFGFNLFDLALRKTLAAGEDTRVYPGEDITFTIEVINQGIVPAANVEITDYIPAGLTLNDADWTGGAGTATATLAGPIAAGASASIDITFTVTTTDAGDLVNVAEISEAEDENGNNPEDVDSDSDTDPANDPGGEVNGPTDDTIDNENGDEDDADPEDITVEIFDLALNKTLGAGEDDRVYPGETITFDITVFNQGTVDAQNIEITDYVPAGLTATGATTLTIAGPLAPGASETVSITFTVDAATAGGQLVNSAEISSAEDELGDNPQDLDSNPDTDPGNDNGGDENTATDDEINDDGTIDEDDEDPEDVFLEIFDLALRKTLAAGEDTRVYPGETVTFDIEVFNQGTVPASNIVLEDYGAAGLTQVGPSTITITGPIAPGASETVQVSFTVDQDAAAGISENLAEIQSSEDDLGDSPNDNDSTEDNDPGNDPEVNDEIDNNGGDEDDADPEEVDIQIFDLALRKSLAAGEDDRVYPGETITFTIEVFNQGTVPASNIVIEDYAPAGLDPVAGTTLTIAGPIAAGSSASVDVSFVVSSTTQEVLENGAEIQSSEDDLGDSPEDLDSTEDNDPDNDPTTNDEIDNANGDEDDDDVESVQNEIFDLASNVTLAPGEDDRVYPGETVEFKVTVFNQGTVPAENVEVTLMFPAELTSTAGIPNMGTITFAGPIAPGAMEMQILEFLVDPNATTGGELIIKEEISDYTDDLGDMPTDIDSTPDADFTNDAGGVVDSPTDDEVGDDGTIDEDDQDPENVFLEIFDIALRKTLAAGEDDRVYPGETITFDIEVFNQGTVSAQNIVIEDYVPAGLTAVGPTTITVAGPIAAGASEVVQITFIVDAADAAAQLVNVAEVADAEDEFGDSPEDVDSTPDNDPNNDAGGTPNAPGEDDEINDDGTIDEDDSDPEDVFLEIFDIALRKTLAAGEDARVYPGETITFDIEVINQGTVPASNIVVEDFGAPGLTNTGASTITIAGPLAAGASEIVQVTFTVDADATAGTSTNIAEIQSAEDDNGDNPTDNDSTPDNDPNNDPTEDDAVDGENGDEDDNDPEDVDIQIFDLASNITLAPGEDDRVYPGETVEFKVTVFNQGTVPGENVEVTLMFPAELTSTAGIPNMGTITFPGPIAPGAMEMQIIEFLVDPNATADGELIVKEEISSYTDDLGNMPADIDSTPDADFTNDAGGVVDGATDDTVDNEDGDEDDADPENVFLEIFDLALRKTLAAGEDERVYPGETITFLIEVFNQGSVSASNIVIADYIPAGFTLVDPNWANAAGGTAQFTLAGPLAPGASEIIPLALEVNADAAAGATQNIAEIQSAEDELGDNPDDVDSTPDDDSANDPTQDDEINDDGTNDEDDSDPQDLDVQIFDLASNITLAPGEDDRVYPGETVEFKVTVFNQGTVTAENVEVTLMFPDALTSTAGIPNMGAITFAGPIAPGAMEMQIIEFMAVSYTHLTLPTICSV